MVSKLTKQNKRRVIPAKDSSVQALNLWQISVELAESSGPQDRTCEIVYKPTKSNSLITHLIHITNSRNQVRCLHSWWIIICLEAITKRIIKAGNPIPRFYTKRES